MVRLMSVTSASRAIDKREYSGTVPVDRIPLPSDVRRNRMAPASKSDHMHLSPHYLSTYCHHRLHDQCRLTCKICAAPCQCPCHRDD